MCKTTEVEKSYKKNSGALNLKHREAISCGEKKEVDEIYSGAISVGTIEPEDLVKGGANNRCA